LKAPSLLLGYYQSDYCLFESPKTLSFTVRHVQFGIERYRKIGTS